MFNYKISINGREYEVLADYGESVSAIVYDKITNSELSEYLEDSEKFIERYVEYTAEKCQKNIYLIVTDQRGYDTYDSAVFCAYTEAQALEFTIERMGKDYENSSVEYIGKAKEDLELGEIVTSFNAG